MFNEPFHKSSAFHYIIIILIIATLFVSGLVLLDVKQIKASLLPQTIDANDFLAKLTAHPEASSYVGISPLNIIQINTNNIDNLQAQIAGLDTSFLGSFIVQYTDSVVIYDYNNDIILGTVSLQQPQQAGLPGDFLTKLNAHPELAGLETEQPIGGQIDQASLDTLMQQFPEVYANAKVGDFLLRYTTRLIIYDYNTDAIVNAVNLG
ncbi:MAG: hypothetical protein QF655_02935 [Candidatus Woesearchaeota archaeon]|jgi:hypothetical protein|nr:hypothetical protein [Candidatus Woesearchaeota archaeon]MDP6265919.1 hypothetical protein [Candidatus Woesearchaeota archaeon]MDP7476557.1 hypothetical protein [Candidatus Woesearchaeota archaeon]|tara:strand:- start:24 stop:644 length:621 start_codon:yes stop_codon:yes gene_type:complete